MIGIWQSIINRGGCKYVGFQLHALHDQETSLDRLKLQLLPEMREN
jgi:hypothetical protein